MQLFLIVFLFHMAKEDCQKRRLDHRAIFWGGILALAAGYAKYGFPRIAYQTAANLLLWGLCFVLIVLGEWLTARFLLGGADLLLWLALAPVLKPLSYAFVLPLACLLALPVQLVKLCRARRPSSFPLVPYVAIAVILILLNGG